MTEPTRTTCPYCGVGCGVLARPDGTIQGDKAHPANFGRLCSKGAALGATIGPEGRLLYPQIAGARASWSEALGLVAKGFKDAIQTHGPDSVAFYVSGQLLTEDYYLANKLMKGFIGSANIDTNSRLCMASSVAGHKRAFGSDTVPGQYEDFELADTIVLVGSNLAWCHPVLFQRLAAAKAKRPGMRVVTVDPRRTATTQIADLHLGIRPDGDTALFNALLAEIARRGLIDQDFVAAHVEGLETSVASARSTPKSDGLTEQDRNAFIDLWCRSERVVTLYSQGVNQSAYGTDKVNAILNCHLASGRIGRPGMGPFSMTGQPNAMGGREVGGLANMLACHLDIENETHRQAVQDFWNAPVICQKPGLKAVDLFDACGKGQIQALWIMSTNPAVSMPDADGVAAAIRSVPFTVVSDIVDETDTARLADVLLPATAWGEKSGTVTNSERRISRQRPFLPAPGEARPDWKIIADVATQMGWGADFCYASEAEVFREYAAMTRLSRDFGRDLDLTGLSGLSDAEYDALAPVVWPVPETGHQGPRFFADGGFYHANRKAKMLPVEAPAHRRSEQGLILLNTGRVRDHWHTMTRTGRAAQLNAHLAEPYLEIHPEDAARIGLLPASLARIESPQGTAILRVMISTRIAPGQAFAPMHWTAETSSAGRVNTLVAPLTDKVSGQPASKSQPVRVTAFGAAWYGFAASTEQMTPERPYAAVARSDTGWRAEIAGCKTPHDWVGEARAVLRIDTGTASLSLDSARGTARVAIAHKERLLGLFFAATEPVAVARAHVIALIGTETPADVALAGVPGMDRPDPGAIVCACKSVGINTIKAAIRDGAASVDALGGCTGAGTGCGACRPELEALIARTMPPALAAE
ncbi:MAG: nitrate reductase [Pseudomonadota bacterium]